MFQKDVHGKKNHNKSKEDNDVHESSQNPENSSIVMHYPKPFISPSSSVASSFQFDALATNLDYDFNSNERNERQHSSIGVNHKEAIDMIDYRIYRHKLMKDVLKKYYDEQQPPGHVVMNSIHLNAQDNPKVRLRKSILLTKHPSILTSKK